MRKWFLHLALVFSLLGVPIAPVSAAEKLQWNQEQKTFDADVDGVELGAVLQQISGLTGWEVFVEPGATHRASAKFKDIPPAEALRRLFGNLNFELSPQSNAVPRLHVFRTDSDKATQRIVAVAVKPGEKIENGKPIPNHLIVTLAPGSRLNIDVLAQQLGAKVIGKLEGLNSYLLEFPDEASAIAAREHLSRNQDVAAVDSNYSLDRPAPFAMAGTDISSPFKIKADASGGDGNRIVVGMLDTAVQNLSAEMQGFLLASLSVGDPFSPSQETPTHGTTMAESILHGLNSVLPPGEASAMRILPVDIYGSNPTTDTFKVAQGIVQAVNGGANILSLSLGSEGNSAFLASLIEQVRGKEILIFAAAGNRPVTTPVYPAAYSSVIAHS